MTENDRTGPCPCGKNPAGRRSCGCDREPTAGDVIGWMFAYLGFAALLFLLFLLSRKANIVG